MIASTSLYAEPVTRYIETWLFKDSLTVLFIAGNTLACSGANARRAGPPVGRVRDVLAVNIEHTQETLKPWTGSI